MKLVDGVYVRQCKYCDEPGTHSDWLQCINSPS
jgi:hypothetical protein